jgi:hypothetical protein
MVKNSFCILGNKLKVKHNNLAILSILFQLLTIENVVHFQKNSFEIGLDVEKFSIENLS